MGAENAEVEVESFLEKVIPLYRHIDLSIESVAGGIYRCRISLNDKTKNHLETVHAAIQFASAEVLGGLVVSSNFLGDGLFIAVRGASIEFHRPARTEIVAEARVPIQIAGFNFVGGFEPAPEFRTDNLIVLGLMILVTLLPSFASSLQTSVGTVPTAHGTFIAQWSVEGTQEKLDFSGVNSFAIFQHTGMVTVERLNGFVANALSKCIGLRDARQGIVSRCVWISASGDQIFSELKRQTHLPDARSGTGHGRIVGGTGRYEGISGSYELSWVDDWERTSDAIKGKTLSMKGEWQMSAAPGKAEK